MGCDVHLFAERREGGAWRVLPPPVGNGYRSEQRDEMIAAGACTFDTYDDMIRAPYRFEAERDEPWSLAHERSDDGCRPLASWFDDRNYRLFGMLAGVRREDVEVVAPPRGMPSDASPEVREHFAAYLEHTPSWLTVAELRAYFAARTSREFPVRGVVTGKQFEDLVDGARDPERWSRSISGQGILVLDPQTYLKVREHAEHISGEGGALLDSVGTVLRADRAPGWFLDQHRHSLHNGQWRMFVDAQWAGRYVDYAARFVKMLDELQEVGACAPEDLRIVFYFDS